MIRAQKQRLADFSVRWCTWQEINNNEIVGCFLSNELIDALPVHQVTIRDGNLQEIYVTNGENSELFAEAIAKLSTSKLQDYWQLNGVNLKSNAYPDVIVLK